MRIPKTAGFLPLLLLTLLISAFAQRATADKPAQSASTGAQVTKVDFVRDVQPIFRQSCYGCHGPTQHMGGFRLDRRADAMRGGTIAVIGPGNSAGSRLYWRLVGTDYGPQMPMTGALKPEQVAVIKNWIDQGAEWPDSASGETPLPPLDPAVVKLHDASLHGDLARLRGLLDQKVNPNARDHSGLTPLMLAAGDIDRTRLLLDRGADVNAKSEEGRTPLIIAAGRIGGAPVVKLLLDRGAAIDAKASSFLGETNALTEAAYAGDDETMRLLIARGADLKSSGFALPLAIAAQCPACTDLAMKAADKEALTTAALFTSPPFFDASSLGMLVERGADANARDGEGRTLLMLAAASDIMPIETARALLARGIDVNAKSKNGQTALSLAFRHGLTPMYRLLNTAGAPSGGTKFQPDAHLEFVKDMSSSARAAVEKSIPILQKNAITFREKSGCVSCHNNSIAALAVSASRANGARVDETLAKTEVDKISAYLSGWRARALQGIGIPGDSDTIGYILFGLAAEHVAPNADTDAMARFMMRLQAADGHWRINAHRPPIESSDVQVTAIAARMLEVYGSAAEKADAQKAVARAASWIAAAKARTIEDHAFKVAGMAWTSSPRAAVERAAKELLAQQRPDGSFAQLPSMAGDAYATGLALFALNASGVVKPTDAAYRKALLFLLQTQDANGTWHVGTRALPIQPFFESGFPYGRDQFISAAATGWATAALASAIK